MTHFYFAKAKMLKFYILALFVFPLPTLLAQVPSYVPSNGLIGWWPFNGNANDESGNGHDGVVNNVNLTFDRKGISNSAYTFNGTSSYINISRQTQLNGAAGTINAWIKSSSLLSSQAVIFGQSNGRPQLVVEAERSTSPNKAAIDWKASDGTFPSAFSTSDIDNGNWMMVTGIYGQNFLKIYVNGTLEDSVSTNLNQDNCSTDDIQIGGFYSVSANCGNVVGLSQMFNGLIDDVGFWDRPLTNTEIQNLYIPPTCSYGDTIYQSRYNQICPNDSVHLFASGPAKGLIFHDKGSNTNGWRYMETPIQDFSSGLALGCPNGPNATTSTAVGTGLLNSTNIDGICFDTNYAATKSLLYSLNGYNDWFLPSQGDFLLMHLNLHSKGVGNFQNYTGANWVVQNFNRYWTSSLIAQYGYAFDFGNGSTISTQPLVVFGRNELNRVRPARFVSGDVKYLWSTGDTTPNISVNPAQTTTYYLTVTHNGLVCTDSTTIVVSGTPGNFAPYGRDSVVLCSDSARLDAGPGYVSYLWSNGANSKVTFVHTPGWYTITVVDSIGCSGVDSVFVYNSDLSASLIVDQNASCFGGNNGRAILSISGGTGPYSINWSNGSTSNDTLANLSAGSYWVLVTDALGCSQSDTFLISQPNSALTATTSVGNVLCQGNSTGSVVLNVNGGTAPYSFLWSNGSTAPNLQNVAAGAYSVIVTDANGCLVQAAATVAEPTAPLSGTFHTDSVTCFGGIDGSGYITVSGGVPPYQFIWSNGSTNDSINNISSGYYSVLITDANGCSLTKGDTIFESATPLSFTANLGDVLCYGDSSGSVTITPSGGRAPYTIQWSDNDSVFVRNGLLANMYLFTLTDALGCAVTDSVEIHEPQFALTAATSKTNVSCHGGNDGSVAVVASGGTGPYSYTWLTNPPRSGNALINVSAGIYPVMVVDANGCQYTTSLVVTEPAALVNTATVQHVQCFGQPNGSAVVQTSGGTAGYQYAWNGGAFTSNNSMGGLDTGLNYVEILDANGCSDSIAFVVNGPPSPIQHVASTTNVSCHGLSNGSAQVIASGGSGSLQITWNTVPISVGSSLIGRPAGTYKYTILDLVHGCMYVDSVVISQPNAPLSHSTTITDVLCHGDSSGSALVTPLGGSSPYSINWSSPSIVGFNPTSLWAGWHFFTLTDANGCLLSDSLEIKEPLVPLTLATGFTNVLCYGDSTGSAWVSASGGTGPYVVLWSANNATNDTLTGIPSGTYSVTVTDSVGCSATRIITVQQPQSPLSITTLSQPALCFGTNSGTAAVIVQGGTGPYSIIWSDTLGSTTTSITQLYSGWYIVDVTDLNGCSILDSVFVGQPSSSLSIQSGTTSVGCFGSATGSAWVSANGGTAPYTYLWPHNGTTNDSITNLSAGTYLIQVQDANQCSETLSISITQAAPLTSITSQQHILCKGDSTGSITVSPQGGWSPYRIVWNTGDTNMVINNLYAGMYSAVITDSLGCSDSIFIQITEPQSPLNSIGLSTDATCSGSIDGSIQVIASGGVGPYSYSLNSQTPITQGIFTSLSAGTYICTITDANGCTITDTFQINEPNPISFISAVDPVTCSGNSDGAIDLTISGGTNSYNVIWSNGATGPKLSGISGGWYQFSINDGNGCGLTDSIFVAEPDVLLLTLSVLHPECSNSFNGSITGIATGGSGSYSFTMNNNSSNGIEPNLGIGTYNVSVVDANGCSESSTIQLSAQRTPCVEIPNWFSPNGNGTNDSWEIPGFEYGNYTLYVVNVLGQKIYEVSSDNYVPWDGTFNGEPLPNGDYYYVISSSDENEPTFAGYVTILR